MLPPCGGNDSILHYKRFAGILQEAGKNDAKNLFPGIIIGKSKINIRFLEGSKGCFIVFRMES